MSRTTGVTMLEPTRRYSFIVAAYNVAAEIGDCLASLTRPEIVNCEIIVVNDGSTDDTRSVIREYEDDPRMRVIDKVNGGASDARNAGIEAAHGEYLMFVDGDDWVEPELTRCFDKTLAENPNADLIVFGMNEVTDSEVKPTRLRADFWTMTNSPWNKLFHRRLFAGARFDYGFKYEDLALIPSLYLRAKQPVTLDATLYNYRRNRVGSLTQSLDPEVLYQLVRSAQRCIERFEEDAAAGRANGELAERLGPDWLARFETLQIFIPGILHTPRRIENRKVRRAYIRGMLERLPARERIRLDQIRKNYGLKMATGALLYRLGQVEAGHFLLHDTGALRQSLESSIKRWRRRSHS